VSRIVKVLPTVDLTNTFILMGLQGVEADRRFNRGLPRLELASGLRDQVLRLVLESEEVEGVSYNSSLPFDRLMSVYVFSFEGHQ
jgi:hypothetical protein